MIIASVYDRCKINTIIEFDTQYYSIEEVKKFIQEEINSGKYIFANVYDKYGDKVYIIE